MYLNITPRANNRKYLSIVHGYRDENGKVKKKTIKSLGYLDELQKKYDDPILHFKKVAKEMDAERKSSDRNIDFSIKKNEKLQPGADNTKNFGHAALSSVYHKLDIHTFLKNRQRHTEGDFNADSVMQSLVYLKLISPFSEQKLSKGFNLLFEAPECTENSLPQCLSFIHAYKDNMQLWIHDKAREICGNDDLMIYYSIHNHCSPTHAIQIGAFTDSRGLPLTYELFPCNTPSYNYKPDFSGIKNRFKMKRMITVSDKGSGSGNLIWEIINSPSKDGYIFNVPMHSACRELKQYILDSADYQWNDDEYKHKSRICPRIIEISAGNGERICKTIEEKQVIFYSPKYAKRARGNSFDGYHILFTSELNTDDETIIEMYRGLWENERSFAITKNDLEKRPNLISVHDFIEINLQISLVAHILVKILQFSTENRYPLPSIINSLTKANCIYLQENFYIFSYYDEILGDIGDITGIPFNNKLMSLGDIKKVLAAVKKPAPELISTE